MADASTSLNVIQDIAAWDYETVVHVVSLLESRAVRTGRSMLRPYSCSAVNSTLS